MLTGHPPHFLFPNTTKKSIWWMIFVIHTTYYYAHKIGPSISNYNQRGFLGPNGICRNFQSFRWWFQHTGPFQGHLNRIQMLLIVCFSSISLSGWYLRWPWAHQCYVNLFLGPFWNFQHTYNNPKGSQHIPGSQGHIFNVNLPPKCTVYKSKCIA